MDGLPMLAPLGAMFFAGDSNCLIFRNRIVDRPALFARPFVTREMFVAGLSLVETARGTSRFEQLVTVLEQERIATRVATTSDTQSRQEANVQWFLHTQLSGPQHDEVNTLSLDPPVVLFAGTMDVSNVLARFGPHFDFWLEDERFNPQAFAHEPAVTLTPRGIVDSIVKEMLTAFRSGIVALRDNGVTNLMIHSIHPSSMDSARYFRIRGIESLARARYKTVIIFNRALEALARACEVTFLDLWSATTIDGVLDARLSLDGDHLNLEAASRTVEAVLESMLVRRGRPLTHVPPFLAVAPAH